MHKFNLSFERMIREAPCSLPINKIFLPNWGNEEGGEDYTEEGCTHC